MWLITYIKVNDYNAPQYTEAVKAASYTQAYINFTIGNDFIILDIKKI